MVIWISDYELNRVFSELEVPHNWQPIKTRLTMLGLKVLKSKTLGEELAVTNEKKFFLMAVKHGIRYTKLD